MNIRRVLEAVLFLSDEAVPASELALLLEERTDRIEAELAVLGREYEERDSGIVLRKVAGGYRLATHPDTSPYLERFVTDHRHAKLTQAALETLAIIAYRQPVSRVQIAEIRGVASDGVIRTLTSRGLVQEVGRDPGPGQAILYGTTEQFLERLGLASLADMPRLPGFMPGPDAVERMESGLGPGL